MAIREAKSPMVGDGGQWSLGVCKKDSAGLILEVRRSQILHKPRIEVR